MQNTPALNSRLPVTTVFAAMALACSVPSAHAADVAWDGGTDTSWANDLNWAGGTAPADNINDDIAVFSGTTAYTFQPTLDAFTVRSVNGLTLGGPSAVAVTIGNQTGTQTTDGAVSSGSNDIILSDASGLVVGQQVTGSRIAKATFITAINGNTITLSQPTVGGTLNSGTTLTFASSLRIGSGGITLAADTPNVANIISAPIVLAANQDWTNNAARDLQIQGSVFLDDNTLTLKGVVGSNIRFNGSTSSQSISGSGDLVIETEGTVTFGAGSGNGRMQNSFTGGVTLNEGRITLDGGNAGGTDNSGALGTGVLTINGGSIGGSGNIAGHALTVSGQVWNADWSFVGGKSVDMGTGQITLGTAPGTGRKLTTDTGNNILTIGGAIVNGTTATNFTKAGSSLLLLTGASTYTGTTTIENGTIQLGGGNDRLPTGTVLTINGGATAAEAGTLDLAGFNQTVAGLSGGSGAVRGVVTNNNNTMHAVTTSILTVTGTSTFDGVIQDGLGRVRVGTTNVYEEYDAFVGLAKEGVGTFTLNGLNTYSGGTTVNDGTLALGETGALTFYIGENGVNNSIVGNGALELNGLFIFDVSLADATEGNAWAIIDSALLENTSFAATFGVQGFSGNAEDGIWTFGDYTFTQSTGLLTYGAAIPEPSAAAVFAGLGVLGLVATRRRRA